jgi:hypothetical protein
VVGYTNRTVVRRPQPISNFVASEEGLRLAKAFMRLRPAGRRRIVCGKLRGIAKKLPLRSCRRFYFLR